MQKMWNIKKIYAAFENQKIACRYLSNEFVYGQGKPEITSYKHKPRFMDLGISKKIITETYDGKQSRPDL